MTSNDIKKIQIIATCEDGQHLLTISEDEELIRHIVSCCSFFKLRNEIFDQCSIKELLLDE